MISGLSLNPVFPVAVILVVTLGLFAYFIWQEARRRQKFPAVRIVALLITLIALLGILSKPSLPTKQQAAPSILLTPGYIKSTIDSIVGATPVAGLYRIKGVEPYPNAETIDINEVGSIPNLMIILGNGLPADALSLLQGANFKLITGTIPEGIFDVKVPK